MALSPAVVAMVAVVLLTLMFGLGATMRDSDIVAVSRRPKGVFVGLGSQFVWMPLIAFATCLAFGWGSDGASDREKLYATTLILQVKS
jgi:predicted Na+-dependent transporter